MNISIRMSSTYKSKECADIPIEKIKQSWKDLIGKFTPDGDYVVSVHDVYATEFIVNIIARNPQTIKRFGGDRRLTFEKPLVDELYSQFKLK
jgi:hypothetical protein